MSAVVAVMPPAQGFPKKGEYEPCGRSKEDLIVYICGFLKGGLSAIHRLKQVLPSIFDYFKIVVLDEKADILFRCGLTPYRENNEVTFFFRGTVCEDPLRAPAYVLYNWERIKEPDRLSPTSKQPQEQPQEPQQEPPEKSSPPSSPQPQPSASAPELAPVEKSGSPDPMEVC